MNKDFLKQIADPDFVEGLLEYLRSKIGQARSHGRMRRKWPNKREHNGLVLFWSARKRGSRNLWRIPQAGVDPMMGS